MCSKFHSKYIIQNKIGEGTFSEVLKCQQFSNGQALAVKKLKKKFSRFTEVQRLPELLVLEKIPSHPNVLPLLEYIFDPQEGTLFMIFELMEMSLYDLIRSRKRCLPETRVKHMLYQILKGLEHLHSNGIFHRDIKPENILIKKTVVKLADLGSIRGIYSEPPYTEYISTRWYRAPECILTAGSYGPKMDIWACGCVYFELLTSKPIFPGANEIDQLTKIHQVTGTPNTRVMMKMRRNKSKVGDVMFAAYPTINLAIILPFTSDTGRELLKRMLVYDPDLRTNVRRLLEHRYFNDIREREYMMRPLNYSISTKQWSSPLMASGLSTDKKHKPKAKEVVTYEKKKASTKLTTNSWAPSTNTSKVGVLAHSKSKPDNIVSHSTVKKRPGRSPVKSVIKKNTAVKPDLTESIKQRKIKANSMVTLPATSCKQELMKLTKNHVKGSRPSLRAAIKAFLPPILEQQDVL